MISLAILVVPWGYTEENGPAWWGEISKAYTTCQTGISQPPIDIQATTTSRLGLPTLNMQYVDGPTRSRGISHMLQATVSNCASNSIEIDETPHYLRRFDFHAPSEHTLNDKIYPLEPQLVRKNQSGDIAIVVVMFDTGEPNQATQNLWEPLLTVEDSSIVIFSPVDIHQLLLDNKTYWHYRGPLITPPCTEGVIWTTLRTSVSLSAEQMGKLHYIVGPANNRSLQPLNKRKITDSYSGDTEILY